MSAPKLRNLFFRASYDIEMLEKHPKHSPLKQPEYYPADKFYELWALRHKHVIVIKF